MTTPTQPIADILAANEAAKQDLIGQRFDVYEVERHNYGERKYMPIGFQSVGQSCPNGTTGTIMYNTINLPGCIYTMWPEEIKKVGTLVITSLK